MDDEAHSLHLLDVVEGNDTDISGGVGSLSLLNLSQNLSSISTAEKGKLPHGPVSAIIVSWAGVVLSVDGAVDIEFNGWDPSLLEKVVNLSGDGVGSKGGKVREGLELEVVNWAPHLQDISKAHDVRPKAITNANRRYVDNGIAQETSIA